MTTSTVVQARFQLRADTAANWTSVNPILLANEFGLETDTKKLKVGNGSTAWSSLAYFPSIVSGGTVLGNLEIGTTGTLTFEGSTADGFETTLAVVDPTADRTITLPNQTGTVIVSGNASIVNADISATAEIAVSKLADGAARQLLQTDAAGTGVEWTDNVDIPGTLDVTSTATFDGNVTIAGDLTVNGTTTNINTQNLVVEDKNVILGDVATPTDVTADGGGITLKGTTDKTINWVDATDAWTLSEHVNIASGKEYRINGTKVLDGTSLGSGVTGSSLTSVGTIGTGVWQGTAINKSYLDSTLVSTGDTGTVTSTMIADGTIVNADVNASAAIAGTKISPDFGSQNTTTTGTSTAASFIPSSSTAPTNGVYLPAANSVGISTGGSGRLFVDSTGRVGIGTSSISTISERVLHIYAGAGASSGLRLTGNAGTGLDLIQGTDGSGYLYQRDNAFLAIGTNNTERLRITSAGFVGVGTSSPDGTTHIHTASAGAVTANSSADDLVVENSGAGGISILTPDGSNGGLFFGSPSDAVGAAARWNYTSGEFSIGSDKSGGVTKLTSGDGTTAVTIDSSQRVGIGTASPSEKCVIQDSGDVRLRVLKTGTAVLDIGVSGSTSFVRSDAEMSFRVAGSETERMRIDTSGRVGIGTATPGNFVGNVNLVVGSAATSTTNAGVTLYSGTATYGGVYFADGTVGDQLYRGAVEYKHDVDALALYSGGAEKARIDSSGRLLVGTTTYLGNARAVVQGNTSNDTTGCLAIRLNSTRPTGADTGIGLIRFESTSNTSNNYAYAAITCETDGASSSDTDIPGRLVFSTTADGASSPTERMRISQNGIAWIYTSGNTALSAHSSTGAGTVDVVFRGRHSATSTQNGTDSIYIFTNGNIQNSNNSYTGISDIKLKENIVDANSQWGDIKALQVRNYNFKEGQTHKQIGLIAQEVEPISPGLVYESPDRDEDGNDLGTVTKAVNYSVLYMKAVKALQEAMERIEQLEAKVAALESA